MIHLDTALKEWAAAIEALSRGETILLLRKGGIREQNGRFTVTQDQVLLYPTYEHQQADLLKPIYVANDAVTYAANMPQTPSDGLPPLASQAITVRAWAQITDVVPITEAEQVGALYPFHIWTEAWVTDRLGWKPRAPLYALLLRTYRLTHPMVIPFQAQYGGCRSWITLVETLDVTTAVPVLSDQEYGVRSQTIRALLQHRSNKDD